MIVDSFPEAGHEKRWEIIALMFLFIAFHPKTKAESVYEQLKTLLLAANDK